MWQATRLLVFALCSCALISAQLTDAQLAEAKQADALFVQHNVVAALPLYEHLAEQLPNNMVYAERLAYCLMSKAHSLSPGPEKDAVLKRVKAEAERAKALGDTSNLLQIIFEGLSSGPANQSIQDSNLKAAEAAFAKGDYDSALVSYTAMAAADPKSYQAPLFVGDMYFRKHDTAQAGEWFQKAILIDPNIETAYRYWGDTLFAAGQKDQALEKFIDAVVAEPYNRRSWVGLTQWAQRTGATLKGPNVPLPKTPPSNDSPWLVYQTTRTLWKDKKFAETFPAEKQYRHTLAEEADALNCVLASFKAQNTPTDKLDPSLHDLVQLSKDGMIEPFIFFGAADQDLIRDYPDYRANHRDLLHAYIEKYLVHPATTP
jgi:tetratricopeptide (TPR) repeat protein